MDGKHANLTSNDIQRRNRIAKLLSDWGLIGIVTDDKIEDVAPLNQIKVIAFKEKGDWILESKYNIGKKKVESALVCTTIKIVMIKQYNFSALVSE